MALLKRFNLKGLDTRNNPLNGDQYKSLIFKNVVRDGSGDVVKRAGAEYVATETHDDLIPFKSGNQLLAVGTSLVKIPSGNIVPWAANSYSTLSGKMSSAEFNRVLYLTNENTRGLLKYDGYYLYQAGVAPIDAVFVSGTAGANTYHYRAFLRHTDAQGNVVNGDYIQFSKSSMASPSNQFNVDYLKYANNGFDTSFDSKFISINPATASITITAVNNYIPYFGTGHNYVVGEYVYISTEKGIVPCEVTSIDTMAQRIYIDFTPISDIGLTSVTYTRDNGAGSTEWNVSNTKVVIFWSTDPNFGYKKLVESAIQLGPSVSYIVKPLATYSSTTAPFIEDEYDTTLVRAVPPKGKYICIHNNILVLAGLQSIDRSYNNSPDPVSVNYNVYNSVYWSMPDTVTGYSVENFPPFNFGVVGDTEDGEISGVISDSDRLVVHKERETYYLSGDFLTGNIRVRNLSSNKIGLLFHKSAIKALGAILFLTFRGLYQLANGGSPNEISDDIENKFTDGTIDEPYMVNDPLNERILVLLDSNSGTPKIMAYDYYYKEWYEWDGLAMTNIVELGNVIYFGNGTDIFKFNDSKLSDDVDSAPANAVAIDAKVVTRFQDLGEPSLVKRFVSIVFFKMGIEEFTATFKTYRNWVFDSATEGNGEEDTSEAETVTADNKYYKRRLNSGENRSLAIEFSNNTINENLRISGYELEYEITQSEPKKRQ